MKTVLLTACTGFNKQALDVVVRLWFLFESHEIILMLNQCLH
jgi:hypothetical protein